MAGTRITRILLSKSDLTAEQLSEMSDAEAWAWLYRHFPPKSRHQKNVAQICFTGFGASDRKALEELAKESHLDVVKTVTVNLRYLVTGPNAGPAKVKKATEKEVVILSVEQFRHMLETGELPT